MVKLGQRVSLVSLGIEGTVIHIDWKYLNLDHMYPIQIELDTYYYDVDIPNAKMYRCGMNEIDFELK